MSPLVMPESTLCDVAREGDADVGAECRLPTPTRNIASAESGGAVLSLLFTSLSSLEDLRAGNGTSTSDPEGSCKGLFFDVATAGSFVVLLSELESELRGLFGILSVS